LKPSNYQVQHSVKISIGICAYNEGKNIERLLNNLLTKQKLPFESEILIICSGCTDSTPDIVRRFSEKDKRVMLILEKERKGKVSAINKLLETYTGDYLFLIPGDVYPAPFSLHLPIEIMSANPNVGVVTGSPIPTNTKDTFSGYLGHLIWRLHNRTLEFLDRLNLSTHASGELMVVRRGVIKKIPPEVINDDAYISIQASLNGFLVKYCKEAKVYIKAPTNLPDFIRQRRRILFGHYRSKKLTGHYPRTLEYSFFYNPAIAIYVMKQELRENFKDLPKIFLAFILEVVVHILAIFDYIFKRDYIIWPMIRSTKEITPPSECT
jgi:biofilm PGA synthesis N-glycosyltransferase PgaC